MRKLKTQKGIVHVGLILVILAGLAVTVYLAIQSEVFRLPKASPEITPIPEFPAEEITTEVPAIENEADLQNTLEELENTDVDMINEMLFVNDEEVSGL